MEISKILIFGFVLHSSITLAGTSEDIAKCAVKDGDASRLICYDSLAKSLGVDKPKQQSQQAKVSGVLEKTNQL